MLCSRHVLSVCFHYEKKMNKFNRLDDALDIQVQVQIIVASLKIKIARTKKNYWRLL